MSVAPMTANAATDLAHRYIRLSEIDVSPTNPRRHFDEAKLAELTESILRHGVLQPILVRPRGDRYELVAGERRFRATRAAGFEDIPAVVKDLDDKQALEVQVIENLQRADLHPLEEAEGYAQLIRIHGYDVEQLALKIGKSKSYVYGRLKLAELCDAAREACFAGTLPHSHALEIARIPDAGLQQKVLEKVMEPLKWGGEPKSFRDTKYLIRADFHLQLKSAKFDTTDAQLVAAAGSCTNCPNRSGNQSDLFDDFDNADVCTLPTCFRSKEEAAWQNEQSKKAAKGVKVLPLEQGKKIARWGYVQGTTYLDIEKPLPGDPEGRTVKNLLPKDAKVAILRDGYGKTHTVIAKKDIASELARAGVKLKEPSAAKQATRENMDYELEQKIDDAVGAAIAAAVELMPFTPELESMIVVAAMLDFDGGDPPVLQRQKLKLGAEEKWLAKLSSPQRYAYFAEQIFAAVDSYNDASRKRRHTFLKAIGVDERAIAKRVTQEHQAAKEGAAAGTKKKGTTKEGAK